MFLFAIQQQKNLPAYLMFIMEPANKDYIFVNFFHNR